ncbi:hypothetical protein CHS0354_035056 [Potamilus streckersoni]|uniref:Meckelin n=1 Tax=Potamilus streckersoni TaxID=2493646 RepID=A0AAE0S6Y8_9BIVA|nr:hypothetical protein CHS0354_035056 [Potamilus streckersoni]
MDLKVTNNGVDQLLAIPINILNLKNTESDNRASSSANWLLVRRFFLVDNQAMIADSSRGEPATMVRYAKSIQIVVRLQDDTTTGLIYPPYFKIDYSTVTRTDAVNGASVDVSFEVTYTMSQSKYERDFQIAIGTLSTLGVIYAGYRTWVWSKRSGRPAIDFPSIINFIFFVSGSLSNVFFVVSFGLAFYWLIFFKRQSVVFLVHPEGQALTDWLGLFAAAFALKCLELIHLIIMQCTVDIFLIDWERSRGAVSVDAETGKRREIPVSIWRTYFVANEWNEIQTTRKINNVFQIFAVVFFLVVVGFENVTTKDPLGNVVKDAADYKADYSSVFRYGTAVCVYLVIGIIQWIFFVFIYERFVEDKVRQFVDLCSMSNISVFIMSNNHFGYYIHGCSVHGKADTDMREMFIMMKKEEEDVVGKRGLEPGTDQQTFMIALPKRLRQKYELVIGQARLESAAAAARMEQGKGGRLMGTVTEKQVEAYKAMNNFFTSFIDNSLRDIRYVVKDKTFLETIMDTEFLDSTEKGIFYNDNGHSFDQVLFYGNEMTLLVFEILLFCIVDLIFTNYIIAGVITYIITELLSMARNSGGTKNLARKTLVDERFLI